jgi:hypothetical protein
MTRQVRIEWTAGVSPASSFFSRFKWKNRRAAGMMSRTEPRASGHLQSYIFSICRRLISNVCLLTQRGSVFLPDHAPSGQCIKNDAALGGMAAAS